MKVVLAALLALAFAAPAFAASEAPSLEPAASWVAGKPVKVFCSQEYGEGGHATPGSSALYVDFSICGVALAQLTRTADEVDPAVMAASLLTFAHEAEHASGLRAESEAECAALKRLPGMASRFFHFRSWRSRHELMMYAWRSHAELPSQYQTDC